MIRQARLSISLNLRCRLLILGVSLLALVGGGKVQAQQIAKVQTTLSNRLPRFTSAATTLADNLCRRCHETDSTFSHPVDMIPSMAVPSNLPLQNGKLTCVTCHEKANEQNHAQSRENHDGLLRGNLTTLSFCAQCHERGLSLSQGAHATETGLAHLQWPENRRQSSFSRKPSVDNTALCLSCHDGAMAGGSGFNYDFSGSSGSLGAGHPIGVLYRGAMGRSRMTQSALASPISLDARIRLFEGKIGCGSCHSPYSKLDNHLVVTNIKSKLCLSCHQM